MCYSQSNLVSNGDFETFDTCPFNREHLFLAKPWISPNYGTPDINNECSRYGIATNGRNWSTNLGGYQWPQSGFGYIGFINASLVISRVNNKDTLFYNQYEYVQSTLTEPLEPGGYYEISMYVSLADYSNGLVHDLAAHLSTDSIRGRYFERMEIEIPTITFDTVISDTSNWIHLFDTIKVDSAYRYITIGVFTDKIDSTIRS